MSYAFSLVLPLPIDQAIEKLSAALQANKLGIVSDVDVQAIFKKKLELEFGGYRILGACAPGLARRVIDSIPSAGTLLPCNIVVREIENGSSIDFMDPRTVLAMAEHPEIQKVAEEAYDTLQRVIDTLAEAS